MRNVPENSHTQNPSNNMRNYVLLMILKDKKARVDNEFGNKTYFPKIIFNSLSELIIIFKQILGFVPL